MSEMREISSAELTQVEGGCLPLLIAGLFVLCILIGGAAQNISNG
jgi:lactobin A/cerein 7B family class IIb bacteriocin